MSNSILEVNQITKIYRHRRAVDNLSFHVEEGEVFGFLGPNGAGKSTTIRLMLSLIKPDGGDIQIFGQSVGRNGNRALAGVGALIEEPNFYRNLSARRNLELLARLENIPLERVNEVLSDVGLADRGEDKVKAYSHGMKQRLGIAQTLLSRPRLLILDEPTSGLDPKRMKQVRDLIRDLSSKGITIFLSSHLLHEIEQVCTSMAIINQGRLVTMGKVEDLLKETELFTTEIQAQPLEKACKVIKEMGYQDQVEVVDEVIKIAVPSRVLPDITRALVTNGVDVTAIVPRTSLEDYFLSLTEDEDTG